ncbi:MAG TPA: serine/threonine-protein kinase [Myxococcus sp.]|nr:serine/threonine-protein kinase [Myxococcus sp.]
MQLGKYQLIRKLAVGGMAEVYLAKAAGPGGFEKTLVLKRILPHLVEDSSFVEMFLAEARLAAGLNHPHIVQIFDFGEAEGSYFLAMEYIDGPNLRRWERQAASKGLKLPPAICAKVVASAAEGLAFAHEFKDPATGKPLGLIHRDVSPDNILVSRQGAVKVVDFGIAKAAGQKHRTQTGIVKGKVAYMPPEQVTGEVLDRRVDVYALGVVLYELLTGRLPFEASNELNLMKSILADPGVPATRYRPDLPRVLQSILATALAKERKDRYPDCRALQTDLERFVLTTGQPVGAYQIAQLVERVVDGQAAPSASLTPATAPLGGQGDDDATRLMAGRSRRAAPEPPVMPTDRRTGPDDPTVKVAPGSHQRLIPVLLAAGGVLLVSGIGYVLFGSGPAQPPAAAPAPTGDTPTAPRGSASGGPSPAPAAAAGAAPSAGDAPEAASGDPAGSAAEGEAEGPAPDEDAAAEGEGAGTASGEDAAGTPAGQGAAPSAGGSTAQVKPGGAMGSVEFRIRPYAVVYLDGKKVGETPFAAIDVPAGTYTVTAVNRTLNKKVSRSFEVKAGEANVFKLNLLEK